MVKTARAAVLYAPNEPLRIEEVEIPALLEGQVLVEIAYSGVCRSQLMEVKGGRGEDRWLPHLLGHEGAGTVLETGKGVTRVKPGDRVILGWIKNTGLEAPGACYACGASRINSGRVTTFSTHSVVSENRLTLLPAGIPMDVAVLFGCALPTGAGMVFNELNPAKGSKVAVLGLGGVGLSALIALAHFDCGMIIAIDPSPQKRALAREFGATHALDASDPALVQQVHALTGDGVDACVEAGGSVTSIETGFALVRKHGGELLFASHPADGETIRLHPHDLISGKRIRGSWGGAARPESDIPKLAELYRQGRFPLEKLLSGCYRLEQVNEALADLESGAAFRPLIAMGGQPG